MGVIIANCIVTIKIIYSILYHSIIFRNEKLTGEENFIVRGRIIRSLFSLYPFPDGLCQFHPNLYFDPSLLAVTKLLRYVN